MAEPYSDFPLPAGITNNNSQRANQDDPPAGRSYFRRRAIDQDVVPTVDISIALHQQLHPLVTTTWIDQYDLSARLIPYRKALVSIPWFWQSLSTICELQSHRRVFGDHPAETLTPRRAEELREEVVAYLLGTRPYEDSYRQLEKGFSVSGHNAPGYLKYQEEWIEERKEYLTEDTWELKEIAVSPQYQGIGLGSDLVKSWLKAVDLENGSAFVSAPAHSKSFFEQFGFETQKISSFDLGMVLDPFVVHQMKRPPDEEDLHQAPSGHG
ncbi:hypothetical protein ONS95_002703 [Cadophora gregata]|uniref:uncharacterized protein n=1 Tax=Cadophora gregata TaxID=51156 RepID=UPI0026DB1E6E|nr:uncharacterized protein ONS95_002703 [Cadophora gregata]KAK0110043.1 hypothetical protein ONS95_002703 [Cadophora gregata]KAK0110336.1 hypothetical protein ONS96_001952 [Cadophora gregata f. sp. sojae]